MARGITEKQRKFIEAYMGQANGNATEAARLAGYSGDDKTLQVVGAQNLLKPIVTAEIKARQESDPLVASREDRQRYLTRVMQGDEYDYDTNRDGEIVSVPAKLREKLKAVDQLNKMGADYTENKNVTIKPEQLEQYYAQIAESTDHT